LGIIFRFSVQLRWKARRIVARRGFAPTVSHSGTAARWSPVRAARPWKWWTRPGVTRALFTTAFAGAILALGGCFSSAPLTPSNRAAGNGAADKAQAAQFTDIPIPSGARMDLDRTLVLGPRDNWIGRLVFTSAAGPNDLFEFYGRELPRFGWAGVTAVRAATSVLSFTRGERVATVQIARTTLGGSEVLVTISPRTGGAMDMGGGAPAQRPPVSTQPLR
jgi:hypothetical protein